LSHSGSHQVGCGNGSSVFPLLEAAKDQDSTFIHCCDFSKEAVSLVKSHAGFDPIRCLPFVCDISKKADWKANATMEEGSLDFILMTFVLSAMEPASIPAAIGNAVAYLKPGGMLFFRDYGEFDMAQLRFKKGKCLADNLYVRGDGTRCYFFKEEVAMLALLMFLSLSDTFRRCDHSSPLPAWRRSSFT